MSGVPVAQASPLAGGEFVCGMVLVITTKALIDHGIKIAIQNDHRRQILLNLICFICAVNGVISYGYNATKASLWVTNVTTVISFLCVQYGLVILNHNTIIRASIIVSPVTVHRKRIENACFVFYFLPFFVLIPIYYAFIETTPKNVAMNTSTYNSLIYKPLNIALIFSTELMATITDVLLLRKVTNVSGRLKMAGTPQVRIVSSQIASENTPSCLSAQAQPLVNTHLSRQVTKNLYIGYGITWTLIICDIILKTLIAEGLPLLFDSIVTIMTITMRAHVNLTYGLQLQNTYQSSGLVRT